ncbi:hypothetical protein [Rufibacter ruber]|uniref:hypothetical protein n=1 Tax=Rufibacter ruber TaxID=1783499 RepID=UPI00082C43EF|nr:hypothetical protein [Rufibacter ruber]
MTQNKEPRQKMVAVKPEVHQELRMLQLELSYGLELPFSLNDIVKMLLISGVDLNKVSGYYAKEKAAQATKIDEEEAK